MNITNFRRTDNKEKRNMNTTNFSVRITEKTKSGNIYNENS